LCGARHGTLTILREVFNERAGSLHAPLIRIYGLLITANLAVWGWALAVFRDQRVLLGTAFLAVLSARARVAQSTPSIPAPAEPL
jgi:hypothetical protein